MNNTIKISTIAGLAVASAITMGVTNNVDAMSQQGYAYAKNNLNLRKEASVTSSLLRTIPQGGKVTKISESNNGWAKVKYGTTVGYCSAQYLTSIAPSQQGSINNNTSAITKYVNTDVLNVRTGPSTSYALYTKLYKGTTVKVVKVRTDGWSEININGKVCYASSQYLSNGVSSNGQQGVVSTGTTQYTKVNLNARTQPNTASSVLKTLAKGTAVKVVQTMSNGWSQITVDGKIAYVSTEYLTISNNVSQNTYSYTYTATTSTAKTKPASVHNIQNAFKKMDGIVVRPGESFSYLRAIGPITTANGYVASGVISGGEYSTGIGGGVCQGSTTLHNAVMKSGLKVVARRNHSRPSVYVGKGLDAMVNDSGSDYVFKNTSSYPVRIRAYVANGQAVVRLESTGDITNGYTFMPKVTVSANGLSATTNVVKTKNGVTTPHYTLYSSYITK